VGPFGAPEGRLVVYPSVAGSVGLRTENNLFQNATAIRPGDRVALVMGREFFNSQLDQSKGQFDLELTLKRFSPRTPDPPSKPLRLRVKVVTGSPPDVVADVERVLPVSADVIDESEETVSIAVIGLRNAPAPAPYDGAPVHLVVRADSDGLSAELQPAASTLLVRTYQQHGAAEAWIGLDRFTGIPLPLDQ